MQNVFSLLGDQIFGSVHSAFFRSSTRFGDLIPDSASKKCEGLESTSFRQQAAQIFLRTVWEPLVCFIRGVKVYGHMSHSSVSPRRKILLGTHPIYYLVSVNGEFNSIKKHLYLMRCLCDFFSFIIKLNLQSNYL